jgi:hypothetical protein
VCDKGGSTLFAECDKGDAFARAACGCRDAVTVAVGHKCSAQALPVCDMGDGNPSTPKAILFHKHYLKQKLQKYFRNTSEILQKYFRNTSEILQKYFRNTSELLQKYFRITSEILQK